MSLRVIIASLFLLCLCAASRSYGQTDDRSASFEGIIGHAAFLDEDPVDHFILGGAVRYSLSPRVSVGPEVVYMIGPGRDRDLFLTGNVWYDLVGPRRDGIRRRATFYLVAGAGLMRHSDRFIEDFSSHEGALTGGLGVRIVLNDRWYIAPEGRLGWEAHSRLSASVGYRFGH